MAIGIPQVGQLVGRPCWAVVGGPGNGSTLTIHLGERIPRKRSLSSGNAPSDIHLFQGQYCIFIEGCAWRMQDGESIIGGWSESEEEIGKVAQKLVGSIITKVTSQTNAFDLLIEFSNRYRLDLFCDRTLLDDLSNYSIRFPEGWFVVNPRGIVKFEASTVSESK